MDNPNFRYCKCGKFPVFRCFFAGKLILLILSKNTSNNVQLKRNLLSETNVIHKARSIFSNTYLLNRCTDIEDKKKNTHHCRTINFFALL